MEEAKQKAAGKGPIGLLESQFLITLILQMPFLLQNLKQLKGSVKEPNMFHNYETEKITRKASNAAENLQLY